MLGIDFAPRAIAQARAKARWRRIEAYFLVWDGLELDRFEVTFDTVVDSAMLHCLGDAERDRFIAQLATVLRPGGSYVVRCDARPGASDANAGGLSRGEFRRRLRERDGWRIDFIEETIFERRHSRNAAYIASITRVA